MYIIEVPDTEGKMVQVPVTKEVYDVFVDDKKKRNALNQADNRHLSHEDVEHSTTQHKQLAHTPSTEEQYFTKQLLEDVQEVIKNCSDVQQKRFYLNRILGYSFVDIARKQGCSDVAVRNSVLFVDKKIKKFLEEGSDSL